MAELAAGAVSPVQDPADDGPGSAAAYINEIQLYEQQALKFVNRGKKIYRRYKDERKEREENLARFNILWSNTQTLLPSCYAKTPVPIVERRYKDSDPVGRVASEVMERALCYAMGCTDFNGMIEQAVLDYLLPGRGTVWVRYEPHIRDARENGGDGVQVTDDADEADIKEEVYDEEAKTDYVHWQDFGHNVCRTWDEVYLVWRKVFLTRRELVKRFGKDVGGRIPLDYTPEGVGKEQSTALKKACIYEMWDKRVAKAIWVSKSHPNVLDSRPDPLELPEFFPCPKPLFATLGTDSLFPVPYYTEYQDQALELDNLTARIASLTKAIKAVGVYDTSAEGLARLLSEGVENQMLPVANWAMFAEKGGLKGAVDWFPMDQIAETVLNLYKARDQVKNDLYEISGMPDIIRGVSDPNETAKAQHIKGQFGSMRLRKMQDEVQRFCRDVLVRMGGIIAKQFSWETLRRISGVQLLTQDEKAAFAQQATQAQTMAQQTGQPPQLDQDMLELMTEPSWEEVEALLKDNNVRGFRIDIETDSTIGDDDEAEKAKRMEFIQAATGLMGQAITASTQTPELAELAIHMVMFGVRSFKTGRTLEGQIQDSLDRLKQAMAQPKPDPQAAQLAHEQQIQQMRIDADKQIAQNKVQSDQQIAEIKARYDAQAEAAKQQYQGIQAQQENELEAQRKQAERADTFALEKYKIDADMQLQQMKLANDLAIARINQEGKIESARVTASTDDGAQQLAYQEGQDGGG
ncbi:molecular chaperone [Dyella marensis]|uniref:hypothetical protein n=1 Tax=Dyella marensis TaxID=500610 RepID=UPI0031E1846B